MSDQFEVPIESVDVLSDDVLTSNMSEDVSTMDTVPVLFDKDVHYFHDVEGGYSRDGGVHYVTLIHRVQGDGSPPDNPSARRVEVHTDGSYYNLSVEDVVYWDSEYPDDDYAVTLVVSEVQSGPYSFAEHLCDGSIDYRHVEVSYDE
jgi:hypothetical protein